MSGSMAAAAAAQHRGAGPHSHRRGRYAFLCREGRPGAGIRCQAAARHFLLQLLQRIRGGRFEQYVRDFYGAACFPTHDGLTLMAAVWPSARFNEVRAESRGMFEKVHESLPSVADRLQRARREEKWVGTAGVPNYFRKPYGPGWALVGDAGYDKDPITAQGISDAFIDADNLAER